MTRVVVMMLLVLAIAPAAWAQEQPRRARLRDENVLYMQGQRALNASRWNVALELFTKLAALNGTRHDAALYWKAYAQNRLGQREEALQTLADLLRLYPSSLFAPQGRALDIEVRRDAGKPVAPESQSDEELKVIALQALQRSDPERAVAMLDGILAGTAAPRLKTRALFVIAESNSPVARQILADIARGTKSPELQGPALNYLGARRTVESRRLLLDIYVTSPNAMTRRRVLRALLRGDDAESLVALARQESDAMRKREIVQTLSEMRNKVALDYLAELLR